MYRGTIEKAREEALALVAACELALIQIDKENLGRNRYDAEQQKWVKEDVGPQATDRSWGSRATGDLRRKSMDLTRLLADLRRP